MGLDSELPGLRRRDEECVVNQKNAFTINPGLRLDCAPDDNVCLCSQNDRKGNKDPFPTFYLYRICNSCQNLNLQFDPLHYLEEICPEQAQALKGKYTCTPDAPSTATSRGLPTSTSPASFTSPSTTQTVRIEGPTSSHPTSTPETTTSDAALELITTTSVDGASQTSSQTPLSSVHASHRSGLSTGAKAGIAIAVAIPTLLLLVALVFFYRRRKTRQKGWRAEESHTPELYHEDGTETAYGAQMNVKPMPMKEKTRQASVVETRELHENERPQARISSGLVSTTARETTARETPAARQHARGFPGTKAASGPTIPRKEVPKRSSVTVGSSGPPSAHANAAAVKNAIGNTNSQPESRSSSRFSGSLRGPVPDMYVYGGADEAELERLEDEERRIDEAIREKEMRARARDRL